MDDNGRHPWPHLPPLQLPRFVSQLDYGWDFAWGGGLPPHLIPPEHRPDERPEPKGDSNGQ